MTKEDIINEYIPFFVKEMLKKADPPKGEEDLIKYSQAFGRELLKRFGGFEGLNELEQIRNN